MKKKKKNWCGQKKKKNFHSFPFNPNVINQLWHHISGAASFNELFSGGMKRQVSDLFFNLFYFVNSSTKHSIHMDGKSSILSIRLGCTLMPMIISHTHTRTQLFLAYNSFSQDYTAPATGELGVCIITPAPLRHGMMSWPRMLAMMHFSATGSPPEWTRFTPSHYPAHLTVTVVYMGCRDKASHCVCLGCATRLSLWACNPSNLHSLGFYSVIWLEEFL